MWKCRNCGSTNVEIIAWYKINTGEVNNDYPDTKNNENTWCIDCEKHAGIEYVGKESKTNKKENHE